MCRCVFLVPFIFGFISCTLQAQDKEPADVFHSKAGKFSVRLPEQPKKQTTKAPSALGEIEVHLFIAVAKDNVYLASYCDYPRGSVTDDNRQKMLDGVRDGNAKTIQGRVVSEKRVTLGKVAGREILIKANKVKGFYRARIFLHGDRLYQVVAVGPGDWAKTNTATQYLDSFKIKE